MKVTQTPTVPTADKVPKVKQNENEEGATFKGLLEKASQVGGPEESTPSRTKAVDPQAALNEMAGIARSRAVLATGTEEITDRIQAVLDRLDDYQQRLADPQISLKEMMPVVSALERQINDLKWSEDKPPIPADLARIASEVAVTAQVEVSKFYRGDYV
jgi:hypothetical protein